MSFRYFVDSDGVYAGSFELGLDVPDGLTEVGMPPASTLQRWDGQQWIGLKSTVSERYGTFRMGIFASAGWARLRSEVDLRLLTELIGAVAYFDENPGLVKFLWNASVAAMATPPTVQEVEQWKYIVDTSEVGPHWLSPDEAFDFNDDGTMY